ncbi:MAG: hypothetical protein LBL72_08435 [Candidatus Accumulibacter sp.]|jgi:hypothetical protein|nr:hypothetical protein [Accumulibacter sp.]
MNPNPVKQKLSDLVKTIPEFGNRVYVEHERLLSPADLPACVIRFSDASVNENDGWRVIWTARFSVAVTTLAPTDSEPETQAEILIDAILRHLLADIRLSGLLSWDLSLEGISVEMDAAGETVARRLTLSLAVRLVDVIGLAEELPDLSTVAVGIDMASPRNNPQLPTGPDGQIDAEVSVDFSEDK